MTSLSRRKLARRILSVLKEAPADAVMRAAAHILHKQRRMAEGDLLLRDIADERITQDKQLEATITSARPLTSTGKQMVTDWLKKYYGVATVTGHYAINKDLVGGAVIETPRHRFKFSVADRLTTLITHS